jgi:hypothetical protein
MGDRRLEMRRRERLRVLAAAQGGVFSTYDVATVGLSRGRARTLVRRGEWVPLGPGVLAERDVVDLCSADPRARHVLDIAAVLLRMRAPGVAVAMSAACLLSLDVPGRPPRRPVIGVPPAPLGRGWATSRQVQRRVTLPAEQLLRTGGLRCTGPARTSVDAARALDFVPALRVVDSALRYYGGGCLDAMRTIAGECAGWVGAAGVAAVLDFADLRSESALETVGRVAMREVGLPAPLTQCWVGEFRPEFRADFGWPDRATIGEADGRVKYTSPAVLWEQHKREDRLRDLGFEVARFGWEAATARRDVLRQRVDTAFERARPGRGRFWPDPPWWRPGLELPGSGADGGRDVPWWLLEVDEAATRWSA